MKNEITKREHEVLGLLLEGATNVEIGKHLNIATHTAKFHVNNLMLKFDSVNRTQVVVAALRAGVITL